MSLLNLLWMFYVLIYINESLLLISKKMGGLNFEKKVSFVNDLRGGAKY